MPLDHSSQSGRAPLKDRRDDLYQSPEEAVRALLKVESLPRRVWEPACGPGAIVRVLRSAGHEVIAGDLVDYGCPMSFHGIDFLMETRAPQGVEAICTNPPYKLAHEFVEKALDLCPKVIMLLRLAFLEGQRRSSILDTGKLVRVHVFRNRLPRMHRHGYEGKKASSSLPFAWFCWDKDHSGPAELRRISWKPVNS